MWRILKLYRIERALHANHLWFSGNCHDLDIYGGGGKQAVGVQARLSLLESMFKLGFPYPTIEQYFCNHKLCPPIRLGFHLEYRKPLIFLQEQAWINA